MYGKVGTGAAVLASTQVAVATGIDPWFITTLCLLAVLAGGLVSVGVLRRRHERRQSGA